eukprot:TRINITY_DN12344_c0_g2_i2.p1 TRINITY_DN12344_c0_g2~~TRINITY_DN12344_c0_g2_i2.p1  ORF type:complete len:244 (+),score=71.38 TRINITY_DN12344_c0_g2_i2:185-916(+)
MNQVQQNVVQTKRKTWDKTLYREKAVQRAENERITERVQPVERGLLKGRDFRLDFESAVGKIQFGISSTQGGFYCQVCDCTLSDSTAYTDHLNGKKHQRRLGLSMRAKNVTLKEVRARIRENKRKMEEVYDFDTRVAQIREEDEREKKRRKEEKKERRRERKGEYDRQERSDEGTKKEASGEKSGERNKDKEEKDKDRVPDKVRDKEKSWSNDEGLNEGLDEEIAAMLGLPTGFGGPVKSCFK